MRRHRVGVRHERAFQHEAREIVANRFETRGCERDGGAETYAEQDDPSGLFWKLTAQLMKNLFQVMSLEIPAGAELPAAFSVGAEVDREDVPSQFVPERRPRDRTHF